MRVVGVPSEASVAANVGEVASFGVDDIPDLLRRGQESSVLLQRGEGRLRTLSYANLTRGIMMMRPYPAFQ